MLLILKRHSAVATMFPKPLQRCWVLAFHNSYGKAVTLPHFTPVTQARANEMMHDLETTGACHEQ